jgi:hypothetical protein
MDYICIGARNLIFKFGRWRSENYEVRVSPSFAPTDSYEIVDALRVADPAANAQPFPEVASWKLLSRFLEPRFHPLETAFHQDNFKIPSSGLPSFVSRQDYDCVPSGEALFRL